MKKLLAIVLVLGVAGVANATYSMLGGSVDILPGATYTITVDGLAGSYGGWLELEDGGAGAFGDLQIFSNAGPDAFKEWWDGWWYFESLTFNPDSPIIAGPQFAIAFTAGGDSVIGKSATVGLYTREEVPLGSLTINVIPEPMTLGLLGLGGLFLRRRR